MTSNPSLLFNPATCVNLGAMMDADATVSDELGPALLLMTNKNGDQGFEQTCRTDYLTQCSWERVWERRLRVYNTGSQTGRDGGSVNTSTNLIDGGYANTVITNAQQYIPAP